MSPRREKDEYQKQRGVYLERVPKKGEGGILGRASDISRKKKENFAGFSGAYSRKNRPISRDFRGKKVKIRGKIGQFLVFLQEKVKIRRKISRFRGKKSNFEGFSEANS